ncbi:hypothetical protein GALMADRAFT_886170 [Galerina marginata CBS 339.88]|uniref:Uncharacterized protein n=1 Tax=Galerina marginata (strain CBS 339.88) TaxID=685588 RepID=A0A067SHY4_GALM3|nr:hypothetical protein GALMADRAFT_886170 [Galerina marginata CBS 339.88]
MKENKELCLLYSLYTEDDFLLISQVESVSDDHEGEDASTPSGPDGQADCICLFIFDRRRKDESGAATDSWKATAREQEKNLLSSKCLI